MATPSSSTSSVGGGEIKEPVEGWARYAMNLVMVNRFHDGNLSAAALPYHTIPPQHV
jgi:hypothetical protein